MHQPRGCSVQTCHGVHRPLVGLPDILLANHQLDPVPSLGLVKPLVSVESHLGAKWLGKDQHIPHHCTVRDDELVGLADGGAHTSNSTPGVHHSLAPCHCGPCLKSTVLNYKE